MNLISDNIQLIFTLIIFAIALIYYYLTHNHNYWSKRGIRGPRPVPWFGTMIYSLLYNRSQIDDQWLKTYGKIYGVYDSNRPVLRVADNKLIKKILVNDFNIFIDRKNHPARHPIADKILFLLNGEDWKRVRSIVSPTFTSVKTKKMFPLIRDCLKDFMSALDKQIGNGLEVDMKGEYKKYTIDVFSTCFFAMKTDVYNNPDSLFTFYASQVQKVNYYDFIMNMIMPNFVLEYLQITLPEQFGTNKVRQYFYDIIRDLINERKKSKNTFNDFIDILLKVEQGDKNVGEINDVNELHHVNEGKEEIEIGNQILSGVKRYMTENEIISNAYLFLASGYEPSEYTLSFCTHELALNTEIQEKLYSEIMSSVDSNGEIDYDFLIKLPFLDAVISETLRLHTPTLGLSRIAARDYKLGDTGVTLSKGQRVEIPVFSIHRYEEYYPNADQFIPERFLPENRHKILPYTYLPFGGGPRNCVGARLVLVEVKLALVHLLKRYKFVKSPNTDIPVILDNSTQTHAPKRVLIQVVKR